MLEGLLTSAATFFATIGPVEAAVLFATLTPKMDRTVRNGIARRASLIAMAILLVFTLLGGPILNQLGVSIAALQTAGGIILFIIAADMVFAKPTSAFKLTPSEGAEAQHKDDLAVFPLATPLLAGPGAMSSAILLAANAHGDPAKIAAVCAGLVAVIAVTYALFAGAHDINRLIGITAQRVLIRVFGLLLASIAVQAVFTGVTAALRLARQIG